jgi:hypothetical protein
MRRPGRHDELKRMGRIGQRLFFGVAAAGLSGLFALTAVAAPPPRPVQAARPLDLSAPAHVLEAPNKASALASMSHQQTSGFSERGRLAQLESAPLPTQPSMQDRVRLFRREGFPVARLWESKSALLHLGLNQKGKPGLWLVQKTH